MPPKAPKKPAKKPAKKPTKKVPSDTFGVSNGSKAKFLANFRKLMKLGYKPE
jgi:hypothetical protein